ncbi:MAG: NADP-dependent oxidoreductase [Calditrichota bacterium]
MDTEVLTKMKAMAIDEFGGLEQLKTQELDVPENGSDQVLGKVESAGDGKWDMAEREGMFAKMTATTPSFPDILGFEGAGTVAATGSGVHHVQEGDAVFGIITARSAGGGFYAEYAAVDGNRVWKVPGNLTTRQAGALPIDGATALRGLRDVLKLQQGESLLIFGASGGIGHLAIQLAKQMGVRVFSVASGPDGVELARRLGSDEVVDGRTEDIIAAAREFAPDGLDAALLTAGGEKANESLGAVKQGGRAAYPNGVQPVPEAPSHVDFQSFSANYDTELLEHLIEMINTADTFEVHVSHTFSLDQAQEAHRMIGKHYLGRIALEIG